MMDSRYQIVWYFTIRDLVRFPFSRERIGDTEWEDREPEGNKHNAIVYLIIYLHLYIILHSFELPLEDIDTSNLTSVPVAEDRTRLLLNSSKFLPNEKDIQKMYALWKFDNRPSKGKGIHVHSWDGLLREIVLARALHKAHMDMRNETRDRKEIIYYGEWKRRNFGLKWKALYPLR